MMTIDGLYGDDDGASVHAWHDVDGDDDWQLLLIDVRDKIPVNFDFRYSTDGLPSHLCVFRLPWPHHLRL